MAEIVLRQLVDDLDENPIDDGYGHQILSAYQSAVAELRIRVQAIMSIHVVSGTRRSGST